jgi:hypothetical protein
MTPFWVNRRLPEVCIAGLKRHPTKCVPGMLQTMAAPLDKLCAGTRDVLWGRPHCSWWINKIKLFFGTSLITSLSDLVTQSSQTQTSSTSAWSVWLYSTLTQFTAHLHNLQYTYTISGASFDTISKFERARIFKFRWLPILTSCGRRNSLMASCQYNKSTTSPLIRG